MMNKKINQFTMSSLLAFVVLITFGWIISLVFFNNQIVRIIVLCSCVLFSLVFCEKVYVAKKDASIKLMMLTFIEQFIAGLSVHKTLLLTFNQTLEVSDERLKKELASFIDVDPVQKIHYLSQIFKAKIYQSFIKIIETYNVIGGDILLSSSFLLKEVAEERTAMMKNRQLRNQTLFELVMGWFFVMLIILMLRFVVSDIYFRLLMNPLFSYGLIVFIILMLISIYFHQVMTNRAMKEKVKRNHIKKKERVLQMNDFVQAFSYFRHSLSSGANVYKALEATANQSQGAINHELHRLIGDITTKQNVTAFLDFAGCFNEPLVKQIMINIFQLMINGGDYQLLFEFNYLFDRLYELNTQQRYHELERNYENLNQLPMLGSGLLVILIMVGVIGLLGTFLYV